MSSPIDWRAARRRAAALAPPGPRAGRAEARGLVTVLHTAAAEAPGHVAEITGLDDAAATAARRPVYVVDRARWSEANIAMFRSLVGDLLPATTLPGAARLGGEELGVMLSYLSTKVLGQYDPFTAPGGAGSPGYLVLVAPNILHVERELDLDALDFRRWVCLHEQTHAVQFAAAPWLADHLRERMRASVTSIASPEGGSQRLARTLGAVVEAVRTPKGETPAAQALAGPLIDAVLTDEERERLAEVVAVMSLLEGHADVVMDAVGPRVLPSVARIRSQFERRRQGTSTLDVLVRRLMGMDAKIAQYRNGAEFVRRVIHRVGHDGLNAVWTSPDTLPRATEIFDPDAWVRRVHG
ncbi:hypothetical protein FHE66_12895 [Georgenia sp. 311]|uniref:Hydrolase n=1 Tax=Georgenia wutianyii TaxID=2585135 RepID=A0ABX5VTK6_9MICO|nr:MULTISPECIES: zinc-dependent metalloprotease [Georgenia]QDB80360.1 hypothetical protein FE251_13955 [Georgenia wutianyii]TNC16943.1 hypothetical protein FHE66_12895 [Georgenia sp. 311]